MAVIAFLRITPSGLNKMAVGSPVVIVARRARIGVLSLEVTPRPKELFFLVVRVCVMRVRVLVQDLAVRLVRKAAAYCFRVFVQGVSVGA